MKILFNFMAVLLIFFSSCHKDSNLTDAVITGVDMRKCACCGGFMITFNGETKPYQGDFKLIDNGEQFGLSSKDSFPLFVKVNWKSNGKCMEFERIELTKLERR